MTIDASPEERVENGYAWLDANSPGWKEHINPDSLNLESSCSCVLGQVFGHISDEPGFNLVYVFNVGIPDHAVDARRKLRLEGAPVPRIGSAEADECGFTDSNDNYSALQDAWEEAFEADPEVRRWT